MRKLLAIAFLLAPIAARAQAPVTVTVNLGWTASGAGAVYSGVGAGTMATMTLAPSTLASSTHGPEMLLSGSQDYNNVLAIQNKSTSNGASAISYRDGADGFERSALGWCGQYCGAPFTSKVFWEGSYFTGSYAGGGTHAPPEMDIVQTGYLSGAFGAHTRMAFTTDGGIHWYNLTGVTAGAAAMDMQPNGNITVGGTANQYRSSDSGDALNIMSDSGQNQLRLETMGVQKTDLKVGSDNGAPNSLYVYDTDHGYVVPLRMALDGTGNTVSAGVQTAKAVQTLAVTVANLPTCNAAAQGTRDSVTDATSPTYLGTLTGGGAVHAPVYCNGTAWVSD